MAYTALPTLGQATMANSLPVVIASNQSALPVTQSGTWDEVGIHDSGNSITVDNGGTFVVQENGAALTALQLIDNNMFADDAAAVGQSPYVGLIGAVFDNTGTDSVDENDAGYIRMSGNRNLYVNIRDNAGNERGLNIDASGQLQVTLAASQTLATVTTVSTVTALGTGTTGPQKAEDVAHANGDMGFAVWAVRLDTPVSGANASGSADYVPFITDSFGKLWMTGSYAEDLASNGGDVVNVAGAIRTDTPVANANVNANGDYLPLITDNYGKLWTAGNAIEDVAHVAGESINANGVRRIDTAASSAGSSGDWATMDSSAEGAVWAVLTPTTTSGCSIFRSLDIDETEEDVKTSAGNVYGYYFGNVVASIRYLKFYNATAANVTVGSTTPVLTFPLPASSSGHIAFPYPISFGTAITVACTTGVADADTGAPGANDVIINVFYK